VINKIPQIKVLHVYKTYFPYSQGGIEEVIYQICLSTSKLGLSNKVICISDQCTKKEIIETPGAVIYCYPMSFEIASCGFSRLLWQDFNDLSAWADIVHYQFPWPFADILALTRQSRDIPYIVSYQSDIIRQKGLNNFYKPLMNKFLKNAAAIVATSPKYIKSSAVLSQLKTKISLIPNGIDSAPSQVSFQKEYEEYHKSYGKDFFLFIGVFRYYKGLNYLLEAAKKSGLPIVIAGNGPEAKSLHSYAQTHKLKNVHFLGHITNNQKYALIALTKALILPASERSEAYGMVLLEAARQSTPMISTELQTGTSYINKNTETGVVVEAKNPEQLSDAMVKLNSDSTLISTMGDSAYKRYQQLFTSQEMAKAYSTLYSDILKNKK